MDYKYIEQLMERYWNAETSTEEESILRAFFSQEDIPEEMEPWRPLFTDGACDSHLGDDFDARMLSLIGQDRAPEVALTATAAAPTAPQRETLRQRLAPLFRAAAIVAIILTLGNAAQAPWDTTWDTPPDYASIQQQLDSIALVSPVQAENIIEAPDTAVAINREN